MTQLCVQLRVPVANFLLPITCSIAYHNPYWVRNTIVRRYMICSFLYDKYPKIRCLQRLTINSSCPSCLWAAAMREAKQLLTNCTQLTNITSGTMKILKYQPCLSMAPSSVLRQGLHSLLCAPCRALNTKPYSAQFWYFNIFLVPKCILRS